MAQQGYQVTGVDLGESAVKFSRDLLRERGLTGNINTQNIMAMEFADRQFDCSICFRLLHHFQDPQDKENLIRELSRVTSRYVIISYFPARSITTLKRRVRKLVSGKPLKQYPDRLSDLASLFSQRGFRLHGTVSRSKILHSLQVAIFERVT